MNDEQKRVAADQFTQMFLDLLSTISQTDWGEERWDLLNPVLADMQVWLNDVMPASRDDSGEIRVNLTPVLGSTLNVANALLARLASATGKPTAEILDDLRQDLCGSGEPPAALDG